MKVLYAEDERQLSMAVVEILKIKGFEVDAVYEGKAASEKLETNHYDAVILDIMMPGMSGIEVLEQMRKKRQYTPVMLLTAKSETDDRICGFRTGADDYLPKPFAMEELIARLSALIRRTEEYVVLQHQKGNVRLDCATNELSTETGSLRLSSVEAELLAYLLKHEGGCPLADVQKHIWKDDPLPEALTLYLSYLETKLNQLHADIRIANDTGSGRISVELVGTE